LGASGFNVPVAADREHGPIADFLLGQEKLYIFFALYLEVIDPDQGRGFDPFGQAGPRTKQEEPIKAEPGQNDTAQKRKSDEGRNSLPHSPGPGQTIASEKYSSQRCGEQDYAGFDIRPPDPYY
jgi:hypothetical protein